MAFDDDLEPDWFHELPFFLTTAVLYAALFTANPVIRWGSRPRADAAVPVEFVASVPGPSPNLAPAPPGDARSPAPPRAGPGEFVPKKVREGAKVPPKPVPRPKPAAPPEPKPRPKPVAKARPKPKPVDAAAVIRESIAKRRAFEARRAREAAAKALAERRAAAAKAEAEAEAGRRAAAAKAKAEAEAAAAKAEAERRAAAAEAKAEAEAAARAARAQERARVAKTLATMKDPDEVIDAQPAAAPAAKAGAAAALAADAAPAPDGDSGDAAGSGGAAPIDAPTRGGGVGPSGTGVSWSVEGPVGRRRLLSREVPKSPDWVGARGLDVTVTVRFRVLPDGSVKPGAVIQQTSGFPELDRRALDAVRRWRFAPAPGGAEVWGRVSFRFTS
jgi:TolA protein